GGPAGHGSAPGAYEIAARDSSTSTGAVKSSDLAGLLAQPQVVVVPVRAFLQKLAPFERVQDPVVIRKGDSLEVQELLGHLVAAGYRREYQVEHRGEVAVRGGIVDVFPADADDPVRIDLWGDEVDRLTRIDPSDQRSVCDLEQVMIFGCRELICSPEVQARAKELVRSEPWGRAQWEKLAEGQVFDGMESWLPWLVETKRTVADLLPAEGLLLLIDPSRLAVRGRELVDEEAALAEALAVTWGVSGGADSLPRLHCAIDDLLTTTASPVWSIPASASGPATPAVEATAWELPGIGGDPAVVGERLAALASQGWSVTVCSESPGTAARLSQMFLSQGLSVPVMPEGEDLTGPGVRLVVQPLERGFCWPAAGVAVLAESDLSGRRRPHRAPRARSARRMESGFFDNLGRGDYVVHRHHGIARYGGIVTRTMGGIERDYLLLEYRGADRLYVPTDQIDAVTPYSGGDSPSLSRMGGSDWSRTRAKVRSEVR
ncbi:MAG: transcription-repair coupling factor, partial [Actinobacteria bacterium]|nr:transcription-repair coupling factor [Actinomycetota bacterium]